LDLPLSGTWGTNAINATTLSDFKNLPDGFEAQSPDEFLCHLHDLDPNLMFDIIRQRAADMIRSARSPTEIAAALAKQTPEFGAALLAGLA
jgi:hypothetical protein